MAEASSTRNMNVCVVDENEIINTSKKRTISAIVTTTQKRPKEKKSMIKIFFSMVKISRFEFHKQTKRITNGKCEKYKGVNEEEN